MKAALVVALIFFYNAGSVFGTDYILVDNPQQLRILNHYEQNISNAALYSLPTNIPLKIVEDDVLLSDQFTRAMQVSFAGKTYFLVRDGSGQLINQSPATEYRFFRNATEFDNPVRILPGSGIEARIPRSDGMDKLLLSPGTVLHPVFRTGSQIYVKISDGRAQFGWVSRDATGKWQQIDPEQPTSVVPDELDIKTRINTLTEHVNSLYTRIFSDLGDVSGRRYPPPVWRMEETSGSLRLVFSPAEYAEPFRESIATMKTEIRILLRDTPWVIADTRDPLIFEINEKENN